MINKLWGILIIIGIVYALLTSNVAVINSEILKSTSTTFEMIIKIFPVLALWLGIMKIAEKSGLLKKIALILTPILKKLFKEIPEGHESLSLIATNIVMNMAGLGSAATPIGLKAISSLQELNDKKDTASNSMITFLVLNTSGVTIIPTTVISMRMLYGSLNPTEIVLPCILATIASSIAGLMMDRILRHDI